MFYKIIHMLFAGLVRLAFGIRVVGGENMPAEGPVILCSNHISNYDPVLIGAAVRRPLRFMAKAELFEFAPLRWLVTSLGAFPIRRGARDTEAIKQAIRILKGGAALLMFPEGHRRPEGVALQPFKSGAALLSYKTGAAVVPVAILCEGRVRLFRRHVIKIGKPITADEFAFHDGHVEELRSASARIRLAVADLLGVEP